MLDTDTNTFTFTLLEEGQRPGWATIVDENGTDRMKRTVDSSPMYAGSSVTVRFDAPQSSIWVHAAVLYSEEGEVMVAGPLRPPVLFQFLDILDVTFLAGRGGQ